MTAGGAGRGGTTAHGAGVAEPPWPHPDNSWPLPEEKSSVAVSVAVSVSVTVTFSVAVNATATSAQAPLADASLLTRLSLRPLT